MASINGGWRISLMWRRNTSWPKYQLKAYQLIAYHGRPRNGAQYQRNKYINQRISWHLQCLSAIGV
jgi:hypothetical protein